MTGERNKIERRTKLFLLLLTGLCLLIGFAGQAKAAKSVSDYTKQLDNFNTASVTNGPTASFNFKITLKSGEIFRLDAISLYHYNYGNGAAPGKITLKKGSKKIGTWKASGNRYRNYYWDVFPGITLDAGTYTVTCSDPSTWSCNSGSEYKGFTEIYGEFISKSSGKNLLINGDAETGTLKGWKASTDKWKATDGEGEGQNCLPYKGKYFFWPYREYSDTSSLYQDVKVKKSQIGRKATLSAYMCVWQQSPIDTARIKMSFLNSKGKTIKSYTKSYSKTKYKKHSITKAIPKGTAKIRVYLIAIRHNGMVDAYFDNVSLQIK